MTNSNVKQKIDGKKTIYVKEQFWDWNSSYKVYNSRKTFDQLKWADLDIRSTPKRKES